MRTQLCDLLGIRVPIIQAPVGSASCPALAAAVANAGAMGMLAATWLEPDQLRGAIRATKDLTSRPFGVNLVLAWPQPDRLAIALEEGIRFISFFWGDPSSYVSAVHDAGGLVLHSVGSVLEAQRAAEAGVDIIVAQGWEAGGHVRGEVALSVLVPAVCDTVAPRPVVAAGGIADGRGVAAALALGAQAVWIGTRFVATAEARVHPTYHAHLLAANDTSTIHGTVFDGGWPDAPHRALRNSTVRAWEAAGRPMAPNRPGEGQSVATGADGRPIQRYSDTIPVAGTSGEVEALAMYAGQSAALVRDIGPAAQIVYRLVAEAEAAIRRSGGYIGAA